MSAVFSLFDWGNALQTVLASLVIYIAMQLIQVWLFGPKLKVLFRFDDFGTVRTREHHPLTAKLPIAGRGHGAPRGDVEVTLSENTKDVVYSRLRVQNTGRGIAKNCRGFLVDVEKRTDDGAWKREYWDSVPLCWSYLDPNAPQLVDIPRGVNFNLDLFSTRRGANQLLPALNPLPRAYEELFAQPGTYRWKVVVAAENAKSATISLVVTWTGKWDEVSIESCARLESWWTWIPPRRGAGM